MLNMVNGVIIPACIDYQNELSQLLERKRACGEYDVSLEGNLLQRIANLSGSLVKKLSALENVLAEYKNERDIVAQANFVRNRIFAAMSELRQVVDELETLVAKKHWRLPSYAELLHSVV
jgi:glutamine synthetase